MKYEVIRDFVDIQDDNHLYRTRDSFPRAGVEVSEERIAELASAENRCGAALIMSTGVNEEVVDNSEEVPEKNPKKKTKEK